MYREREGDRQTGSYGTLGGIQISRQFPYFVRLQAYFKTDSIV
jgi:hypothetical protein